MTLPVNEPTSEVVVSCKTASVGTTPVAAWAVAPVKGRIVRTYAVLEGTITGTAAIAVAINGWNRLAIAFRAEAGTYQPPKPVGARADSASAS